MKKIKTIELKAAFLLILFLLNTIIGFSCAVVLDLGSNANHHEEDVNVIPIQIHTDDTYHQYNNKTKDHYNGADFHLHKTTHDEDCRYCKARKIAQQHNALLQSINKVRRIRFTASSTGFHKANIIFSKRFYSHIKYYVQGHHLSIVDIRIAIQCFQI